MSLRKQEFELQDIDGKVLHFSKKGTLWTMHRCWQPEGETQWDLLTELEVIMVVAHWLRQCTFVEVV